MPSAFSHQLSALWINRQPNSERFPPIEGVAEASELEYHLLLAKDLSFLKPKDREDLAQRATELNRMLTALRQKLRVDG